MVVPAVVTDPAVVALRTALEQRLDELSDLATAQIVDEIPAYADFDEPMRRDVCDHVRAHLRATLEHLGSGRDVTREDLLFVRPHAARRARRVSVSDFVQAFYVGEQVLWRAALELAKDDASRGAALTLASHLPRYFEVATTHAAEVYVEAQEQLAATGERIRRDLLEDLLAGRELELGPRLDAAAAVGLSEKTSCLVISATAQDTAPADEDLLRGGAAALSRAAAGATLPLAVVRREEIVLVVPTREDAASSLISRLSDAQQRLAGAGLPLAVAVSTVVPELAMVPDAYREAWTLRHARRASPGVVSLNEMSAFEWLTLRADATASRLIAPAVHAFVAQDADDGGPLISTLRAYLDCDLNARRAAERLHVHVNTAHYRLGRIAERTGCDLRRVSDLIEILIAARLADAEATT
ncbi:MAG TPA: helix-turn-helix domain-containing protein [Solirubrobacteraceae bacterium]